MRVSQETRRVSAQEQRETSLPYRDRIQEQTRDSGIWDYVSYNKQGDLLINNVPVVDIVAAVGNIDAEGAPVEIIDTRIITRRATEWEKLVHDAIAQTGYKGGSETYYATKANRTATVVHAALRSNWHLETSWTQDLEDIETLAQEGLFNTSKTKIICNGFKYPPHTEIFRDHTKTRLQESGIIFEYPDNTPPALLENSYAQKILTFHNKGFNIVPVLDSGELDLFAGKTSRPMDVGLRFKFGKVKNQEELDTLSSRFGMNWDELSATAQKIAETSDLTLTTLHTMMGAAESIPVEDALSYLEFAADKYFTLKKEHPSLTTLDIGGGIPPKSDGYNHAEFLQKLFTMLKMKAETYNLDAPQVVFELGSYLAAESTFYVFDVLTKKVNGGVSNKNPETWAIIQGSLMSSIPDMLITQKRFNVLAANNANAPSQEVVLGDLTCDSDGRYPTKAMLNEKVLLPNTDKPTYVVIAGVGAYQAQLAGTKGGHHCGLLEAAEVVYEVRADGNTYARVTPRQSRLDSQTVFEYTPEVLGKLLQTV